MIFTRKKVSTEKEKDLITGLITDTLFCRELLPLVKRELLQVDQFKYILNWVEDYFAKYEEAPRENIQKIFTAKGIDLDKALRDNLEIFLRELSERYERKESFNTGYFIDQSILYLKERNLKVLSDKITGLIDTGGVEEAENEVVSYYKVAKTLSNWVNPFDDGFIENVVFKEEDYLLQIPGALGLLIGKMRRREFYAIMAPMKRGKTWFLLEIAWLAASFHLKVAFISLEMEEERMGARSFKRVTAKDFENDWIIIPIFDCILNQKAICNLPIRESTSSGLPLDALDLPPAYSDDIKHKACSVCRTLGNGKFDPGIWYEKRKVGKLSYAHIIKAMKSFKGMFGDNVRMMSYPINTANIGSIKRDLDLLEYTQKFVPDVIIIDYADILGREESARTYKLEGRESINETWKMMRNLSQERNSLVWTATQSNRNSMDKKRVKPTDTSEDIRKLAHVNGMFVLSQTSKEKKRGLMRVGAAVLREEEFDVMKEVYVTQNLTIGQPFLDSEILKPKKGRVHEEDTDEDTED